MECHRVVVGGPNDLRMRASGVVRTNYRGRWFSTTSFTRIIAYFLFLLFLFFCFYAIPLSCLSSLLGCNSAAAMRTSSGSSVYAMSAFAFADTLLIRHVKLALRLFRVAF